MIELAKDDKDNGRKVVPLHTGKVQIGIAYQPKPTQVQAQWLERHTARRSPILRWTGWSALALLALIVIAKAAR